LAEKRYEPVTVATRNKRHVDLASYVRVELLDPLSETSVITTERAMSVGPEALQSRPRETGRPPLGCRWLSAALVPSARV
jgi:hypothetical protein